MSNLGFHKGAVDWSGGSDQTPRNIKNDLIDYLRDEAISAGIPLEKSDNLYALAWDAIQKTPVGKDILNGQLKGGISFPELVTMIIGKLTVEKPKKSPTSFNKKYVNDYLIPNAVLNLKKKKVSLEKIKGHKSLQRLMEDFSVSEDLIDRVYSGDKKPLRVIPTIDKKYLDDLYDRGVRPAIFAKYMEGKDEGNRAGFIGYWRKAVIGAAHDFYKSIKKIKEFDQAKTYGQKNTEDLNPDEIGESEIASDAVSVDTSVDDKMAKKTLFRRLSLINPKYEALLECMVDGKTQEYISKALGIPNKTELKELLEEFSKDLAKVIKSMELNREETARVLRAKKIATAVFGRVVNAGLL